MSARTMVVALAVLVSVSSAHAQDDAYRYGYLRTVEPGVTLQRASEAAAEVATANMPFLPGDRVWTDDAGRMEVHFADGSVLRLDSRSKLDYLAHEAGRRERVVLRLSSGALVLHVRDQKRSPDFVVETPEGVMVPTERGVYRLDVQPGEARVAVLDGEADVEAGRRVRVERGQQLLVREGEPYGKPEQIAAYDVDDAFGRWDRDLEEGLAQAAEGRREEWLPEEVAPYGGDFAAHGSWRTEPAYGNVWYPRVQSGWRPYSQGHWAWTMFGWTWVPNERWGWATSHYGRWGYSDAWFWIPGRSWGPGWVNWSVGGDHVGWCPLGYGDRPVYVRSAPRAYAVRRGTVHADTVTSPWTYVRRTDMGQRDLARRRVDSGKVATGELRTAPAGQARLSRDLRLVAGPDGVSSGQPAAGAVPRKALVEPTQGNTVPELQADPTTTGGTAPQGQAGRVTVPRAPRAAVPWLPAASAPRPLRPNDDGQASTGQGQAGDAGRAQRMRPRAEPGEPTGSNRGERDREILRPIFGPLSRPRVDDGASRDRGAARSRPEPGAAARSGSDSGGSRPAAGASSRPGPSTAPPKSSPPPAAERAQPSERAKPRERN